MGKPLIAIGALAGFLAFVTGLGAAEGFAAATEPYWVIRAERSLPSGTEQLAWRFARKGDLESLLVRSANFVSSPDEPVWLGVWVRKGASAPSDEEREIAQIGARVVPSAALGQPHRMQVYLNAVEVDADSDFGRRLLVILHEVEQGVEAAARRKKAKLPSARPWTPRNVVDVERPRLILEHGQGHWRAKVRRLAGEVGKVPDPGAADCTERGERLDCPVPGYGIAYFERRPSPSASPSPSR